MPWHAPLWGGRATFQVGAQSGEEPAPLAHGRVEATCAELGQGRKRRCRCKKFSSQWPSTAQAVPGKVYSLSPKAKPSTRHPLGPTKKVIKVILAPDGQKAHHLERGIGQLLRGRKGCCYLHVEEPTSEFQRKLELGGGLPQGYPEEAWVWGLARWEVWVLEESSGGNRSPTPAKS